MIEGHCVSPSQVKELWPHVQHFIRFAMEKGRFSEFESVERNVLNGPALLWVVIEGAADILAAAVTELHIVNGEKFCTITACGGRERGKWIALKSKIEDYARNEKCGSIRIYGRRGWASSLPDYKLTRVLLEKELN